MLTHPRIEPKQLSTWTQATSDLLQRVFGDDRVAASFGNAGPVDDGPTPSEEGTKQRLVSRLAVLSELIERAAELYQDAGGGEPADASNRVLVIHSGHQAALEPVTHFVERIGCESVVFNEPGNAPTRIEKLRQHTDDVAFAVVLLTGDDLGRDKQRPSGSERPRAPQSAILELGYLIAALGQKNVCALYYPSVEVPSDSAGVVFIPFDDREGWQSKLLRELKNAGLAVDFEKLA